ncbi:hypothetical protein EVAR_45958_1 [Eumeta japonica]|uniref:Uncharacterized protein n=1 Tax=Eumeta variegata TaxID=151549 RepID=A0A4C1YPJ8_EUMVA|nr:hypothetical protein EVAR_45958_1 [Eumeta japonica]
MVVTKRQAELYRQKPQSITRQRELKVKFFGCNTFIRLQNLYSENASPIKPSVVDDVFVLAWSATWGRSRTASRSSRDVRISFGMEVPRTVTVANSTCVLAHEALCKRRPPAPPCPRLAPTYRLENSLCDRTPLAHTRPPPGFTRSEVFRSSSRLLLL